MQLNAEYSTKIQDLLFAILYYMLIRPKGNGVNVQFCRKKEVYLAYPGEDDGTSKTPPVADRARASSVATEEGNDESAVTPTKGAASGSTHGNTGIGSTSSSIKRGRTFRVRGYQRQSSLDSPLATPISEEGIGASASMNEPVPGRVQDTARDDEVRHRNTALAATTCVFL